MVSTDFVLLSHSSDWNHRELETTHGNILGSLIYIQCVCVCMHVCACVSVCVCACECVHVPVEGVCMCMYMGDKGQP